MVSEFCLNKTVIKPMKSNTRVLLPLLFTVILQVLVNAIKQGEWRYKYWKGRDKLLQKIFLSTQNIQETLVKKLLELVKEFGKEAVIKHTNKN